MSLKKASKTPGRLGDIGQRAFLIPIVPGMPCSCCQRDMSIPPGSGPFNNAAPFQADKPGEIL